ncbi:hypothetical protein [Eubacterium callanderi]|uniref:hypothetical protein n=1 Tax=Eubacterium callanderi TaxID=53442 RepID=UPI0034A0DFDE
MAIGQARLPGFFLYCAYIRILMIRSPHMDGLIDGFGALFIPLSILPLPLSFYFSTRFLFTFFAILFIVRAVF